MMGLCSNAADSTVLPIIVMAIIDRATAIGFGPQIIAGDGKSPCATAAAYVPVFASAANSAIIVRILQSSENRMVAIHINRRNFGKLAAHNG